MERGARLDVRAARQVFYRIISRNAKGGPTPIDVLLARLEVPLLLLWGERDPWIVSAKGDQIQASAESLGRDVRRVRLDAGHCPHDEAPDEANAALIEFAASLA